MTGTSLGDAPFPECLRDGTVLCALANAIRAGSVKRVNKPGMPFREMENVTAFIGAARALGVPESDLFNTIDLYEAKDYPQVVTSIHALGRTIQRTVPEFAGPKLGVKMATAHVSVASCACDIV